MDLPEVIPSWVYWEDRDFLDRLKEKLKQQNSPVEINKKPDKNIFSVSKRRWYK